MSRKIRTLLSTISLCLTSCLLVAVLFGWYVSNKQATVTGGAGSVAKVEDYQLAVCGESYKDSDITSFWNYGSSYLGFPGISSGTTITDAAGNVLSNCVTTSSSGGSINWLLSDDSNFGNNLENTSGLKPGSKGKLTFYVIPKKSGTQSISFGINLTPYESVYNKATKTTSYRAVGTQVTDDVTNVEASILAGHILFFQNYDSTTKKYSNLIDNNFTFEIENAVKDVAYPVTIYWIWNEYITSLIGGLSSSNNIIDDSDIEDMVEYVYNKPEQFFYSASSMHTKTSAQNFYTKVQNYLKDETNSLVADGSAIVRTKLAKLVNYYNNGDQLIGSSLEYVVFDLTAH